MEAEKKFIDNITKMDRSSFSTVTGLRAGLFAVAPLIFTPLVGFNGAAFAALGAMWLANTESPSSKMPIRVLLVAALTESLAVGLGTLTGTAGSIFPLLGGLGIFLPMLLHGNPKWTRVGTFTAITFAVGVGLPGLPDAAALRAFYSVGGALWALAGISIQRFFQSRKVKEESLVATKFELHPDAIRSALTMAAASAFGFWVGMALNLPRDFWVVITIIITVQPSFNSTLTFTSRMVLGTIAGALLGAAVLRSNELYLELAFLAVFAVLMFASRGVNLGLLQVFLAPFIIILLALIYGGKADYAEARVIDVAIGGVISIATVYILRLGSVRKYWKGYKRVHPPQT